MRVKDIKNILKMDKVELLNHCFCELSRNNYEEIIKTDGYVYAKGDIPILLVAHCDTVHRDTPKTILYDEKNKMMWSPEGIGGDDRCGVIAIYEIIKEYKPYILFTQDEEIGGIGVKKFCENEYLDKVKFAIEIDRRGNNQAVFYDCGNKELEKYICEEKGFEKKYGSFTDVCFIGKEFDVGIVNVSAGYYNEHQKVEYIDFRHLYNTINKIKEILEENIDTYFDYQESRTYYPSNYKVYNYTTKKDEKNYTFLEEKDWEELDEERWLGWYGYPKPKTKQDLYKIICTEYFD